MQAKIGKQHVVKGKREKHIYFKNQFPYALLSTSEVF